MGSQVDLSYKSAKNQRLHVEIGLMKMASISQVLNLASLPANNDEAEKKNSTDVGSAKEVQNNVPIAAASVVAKQENLPTIEPAAVSSLKPKFKSSKLRSTVDLEVEVQASNQVLETETKAAEQVMENKPFDLKGMEEALLACGKTMETQSQSLILKSGFELVGNQVTLKLVNQTLMDLFDELKQDILDFVRKKLQN